MPDQKRCGPASNSERAGARFQPGSEAKSDTHGTAVGEDGEAHPKPVLKVARWTGWDGSGREHLILWRHDGNVRVESVVQGDRGGSPYGARYAIDCDHAWRVQSLEITSVWGPRLHITADGSGHWHDRMQGTGLPELDGCIDVDVAMTPFTNTLPIRRLGLEQGASAEIRVAYVPLPSDHPVTPWRVEPARQRYTCVEPDHRYLYEVLFRDFTAELEIDADGFVLDYPDTFRRLPTD